MKRICISSLCLFFTITLSSNSYGNEKPLSIEKQYFGEKPQSLTPKFFDPKIVSPQGRFEGGMFSPDMTEFYFTRKMANIKSGHLL